jgi:branched-chain amino acid transport system permease protein
MSVETIALPSSKTANQAHGARRGLYVVLALVVAALPWLPLNPFVIHLAESFCYTAIAVISLNVLLGLSGQMSLGQAGFYALGAYGSALAALRWGWPVPLAIGFGTIVAAVLGAVVGVYALRTRGLYLAMATMAVGFVIEILAQRWIGLTGGAMGLASVPQLEMGGHAGFLYLAGGCLLLVQVASDYVNDSRTGRRLRAVRESEAFASAVGVVVPLWRAATFSVCAALAGLGGALFAHQSGFVGSDAFTIRLSVSLLIAAVIGGLGTRMGPLLGTAVLLGLAEFSSSIEKYGLMLHGAVLLLVLLAFPEGAAGILRRLLRLPRQASKAVGAQAACTAGLPPMPPGCGLSVSGVSKSYAGVRAVSNVTIEVAPGSIHGLIGPNGAGKSTLINVISGQFACDSGRIRLGTEDVTAMATPARARYGLARTFQNLQLIEALPAIDNVQLGIPPKQSIGADFMRWWSARGFEADERAQAMGIMEFLRVDHLVDKFPSEVSYGHRKLIELSRAVAQRPRLMLLDEPIAGLNAQEAREVATAVKRLNEAGVTIVVVEHNMEFVMSICDRVSVLDHGELIMTGTPVEVQKDGRVIAAYLGGQSDD